jgi:hypothetical protein
MPAVPDPTRFTRALIAFFGDDSSPGYSPTAALDGNARIRAEFPEHAADLSARIEQMFAAAFGLPGLESLALEEAIAAIREFVASEYRFLPAVLQAKVVNRCAYCLWK